MSMLAITGVMVQSAGIHLPFEGGTGDELYRERFEEAALKGCYEGTRNPNPNTLPELSSRINC